MSSKINICYLCGQELKTDINDDHVPPKQFYPKNIRKSQNLSNLLVFKVHENCNSSYQKDEDYFVHSIAPVTLGSFSGNEIFKDIASRQKRPEGLDR